MLSQARQARNTQRRPARSRPGGLPGEGDSSDPVLPRGSVSAPSSSCVSHLGVHPREKEALDSGSVTLPPAGPSAPQRGPARPSFLWTRNQAGDPGRSRVSVLYFFHGFAREQIWLPALCCVGARACQDPGVCQPRAREMAGGRGKRPRSGRSGPRGPPESPHTLWSLGQSFRPLLTHKGPNLRCFRGFEHPECHQTLMEKVKWGDGIGGAPRKGHL